MPHLSIRQILEHNNPRMEQMSWILIATRTSDLVVVFEAWKTGRSAYRASDELLIRRNKLQAALNEESSLSPPNIKTSLTCSLELSRSLAVSLSSLQISISNSSLF